jgi:hypothetical protein
MDGILDTCRTLSRAETPFFLLPRWTSRVQIPSPARRNKVRRERPFVVSGVGSPSPTLERVLARPHPASRRHQAPPILGTLGTFALGRVGSSVGGGSRGHADDADLTPPGSRPRVQRNRGSAQAEQLVRVAVRDLLSVYLSDLNESSSAFLSRVIRGAAFDGPASEIPPAYRYGVDPSRRDHSIGVRCVRAP